MFRTMVVGLIVGWLPWWLLDSGNLPVIVAHRGASHDAPENTLAAFQLAWQQKADAIEADFFLTKDGRIVCIHDKTTRRTTAADLTVANSTWSDLAELDAGSWKDPKWSGERIPTIEQVFQIVPRDKKIYVEIKCGPEIVPGLLRAIGGSGLKHEQIVVISFQEAVIREVESSLPQLKTLWLVAYDRDADSGRWSPPVDEVLATLGRCQADGLGTEAERAVVTREFVEKLRQGGYEFHTWTVDKPDAASYFASLGVDAIITNRPGFIREQLRVRKR